MQFNWRRAAAIAALIFLALFLLRLLTANDQGSRADFGLDGIGQQGGESFENSRKNYASSKALQATGQPIGDSQKYEKIGSLTQTSKAFDTDRSQVDAVVEAKKAIVQLERATGLSGSRVLHLGIGVPPDNFDGFIEDLRKIGNSTAIEIVKNDKTNEYLQLRAKRATLEKARASLEGLQASGGSIDERVKVQNRLTEIEQEIQNLGVALGDYDSANELCTVRLTLREGRQVVAASWSRRVLAALEWTVPVYAGLGIGFLAFVLAGWLGWALALRLKKLAEKGA